MRSFPRLAIRFLWAVSVLLGSLAQASAAPTAPVHGKMMSPQEQMSLTDNSVAKVIDVLPKLISLTKSYTGNHSAGPGKKTAINKKYKAFTSALTDLSGKHGFKDMRTMQRTVEATMLTAGFIKSGRTLKQVEEKMLATQKLVEENDKMTAIQKSALLRRMHIQISMVIPTPENIKAVKPFYPRIIAITGKKK